MIDLYHEAKRLSGALLTGSGEIYSSYTHPKFLHPGQRDTKARLAQLGVPFDLTGKTVLELGCNTGAVSLELARRGAKVTGLEYNKERVLFCRKLFDALGFKGTFEQADLNDGIPGDKYDMVFSLAVDAYIKHPCLYYKQLAERTSSICWLESNYPSSHSTNLEEEISFVKRCMTGAFATVKYMGLSTKKGRRLFGCGHRQLDLSKTRTKLEEGWYVRTIACHEEWVELKTLCQRLVGIPQVPRMDFPTPHAMRIKAISGVSWEAAEKQYLPSYRRQFIDFMVRLNRVGLAHRDLHYDNLIFSKDKLWVVDWEYLCENKSPLETCYDLTGKGCNIPGRTPLALIRPQFVFDDRKSIGQAFGLKMKDFLNYSKTLVP